MSACLFSILTLNLVLTQGVPPNVRSGVHIYLRPYTIGPVTTLSGHALRADGVHCRESVVSKHNHCCTAAVHTVDPFFPPDLCLYKRRKFSVHGTVSYVVFQNIPGYDVLLLYILWNGFYPSDLCL